MFSKTLALTISLLLVSANASAKIVAQERYLANIDAASSSAEYGVPTGFSFGYGGPPITLGPNADTTGISGQFFVSLTTHEVGSANDPLLTINTYMSLEDVVLKFDNPGIPESLVLPHGGILLSRSQRPNPDYDPFLSAAICGCFTSISPSASYILPELGADSLRLTGASGDDWRDPFFTFDIQADIALVSGSGSLLESALDGGKINDPVASSPSVQAIPLPPAFALGGVAVGLLGLVAWRKEKRQAVRKIP